MKSGKTMMLVFFGVILLATIVLTLLFGKNFRQYSGRQHSITVSVGAHSDSAAVH